MAAMLLGTASCSNDMEPAMTGDNMVQFKVELPGNIDSRAISDGLKATQLQVAVYKEDGTHLNLDQTVTMTGKTATVTFKLVKGLTYKFAFWAQNPNEDAYTFDAATGKVTVDYSKAIANADDGDAFSNTKTLAVTGPMTETIYLHRPFAQLNYGDVMEDYTAAMAAGIDFAKTAVTVKQVATSFDIMNQTTASDNLVDVTWPAAASAIGEDLTVEEVAYKWLSMCYFLVPADEATVETELSLLNTAGTEFNKIAVSNVPVQKNHRTNILGSLFTDDVNFNVIIDERFDEPDLKPEVVWDGTMTEPADITGDIIEIKDGGELAWVLNSITNGTTLAGKTFKLTDDINLGKKDWPLVNVKCSFTLDGNNKTIKGLKSTGGNYGGLIGKANNQVVIRNLTIADSEIDASGRTDNENAAGAFIGWCENHTSTAITLENCKSVNVKIGKAQYNAGLVGYSSRININNCLAQNDEIISDYDESGDYKGHSGCIVGYGNFDTTITNTRVADSQITGRNDRGRVGIFYGTAQSSVTIGTGNSVKNVTILGTAATSANLVGAVDARSDKSNDATVVFE